MRYRPPLVDGEKSFGLRPFEKPMRRINDMERKMPRQLPPLMHDRALITGLWVLGSPPATREACQLAAYRGHQIVFSVGAIDALE